MTYVWIVAVLFLGLPAACQLGYRLGLRAGPGMDEGERSHASAWQAALLGLAALLIGFTFSMAQARYDARKHIVLEEANDIGTTYLRTRLLDDARGEELRVLLRRYIDARLAFAEPGLDVKRTEALLRQSSDIVDQIWTRVAAAGRTTPSPTTSLLIQSTNAMIDAGEDHVEALKNPLPSTVFVVLILVTAVAMLAVGYGCGLESRMRALGMFVAPLLLAAVIALVFDLAHPRMGIIRVRDPILARLKNSV
ncbi:MAG TPA: hypothetical protein VHO67_04135 [Polyangia bacterium]|nr:hypothetical protein [Polyangia bacterium]